MNSSARSTNQLPSLIETSGSAFRFSRDINDFFNSNTSAMQNVPAINVVENADGFRIEVAAPGLSKNDFKVNLNHNNLAISAYQENKQEEQTHEKFTRREFSYASFQRIFTLPTSIDSEAIQATYTDGVLKISIPKREEAKVKPARQIVIG